MLQKLQLRKVRDEDRAEIVRLHKQYPRYCRLPIDIAGEIVVAEGDKIVGYGALEVFAEPIVIIDQTLSTRDKAIIIKQLFKSSIQFARFHGIHDFFTFIVDAIFANILRRHFGFRDCKGNALVHHVDGEI